MNAFYQGGQARQKLLLALACLGWITTGCSQFDRRPKVPIDSSAGLFDSARIEYKLDAGQLNLPLAVTRVEGQLVSYDQVPSDPRRDASVGTLKIEYPHPEGRTGYARARLEITSTAPRGGAAVQVAAAAEPASTWGKVAGRMNPKRMISGATPAANKVDEVWELDVPRAHLDRAMASLNQGGYFDTKQSGEAGVAIQAKVDGKSLDKNWRQVQELNELMMAVRNQGQLVAYSRPATDRSSSPSPTSLVAYERFSEQDRLASLPSQTGQPALPSQMATPAQPWAPSGAIPASHQVAGQSTAPPVVPYFPAPQPVNAMPNSTSNAVDAIASGYPSGDAPPLPRQDSIPWRAGSRPAPAMPPQPPAFSAPAMDAAPNVAQQPRYPATPY